MTKVLVTGGAGFIGSNLVRRLVDQGYTVDVVDNLHTGSMGNLEGVNYRRFFKSIYEPNYVVYDYIVHLGMYSSSPMYKEDPGLFDKVLNEYHALLSRAYYDKIPLIVTLTSSMYHPRKVPWSDRDLRMDPQDLYSLSRYFIMKLTEVYHRLYRVKAVCLILFSVYGPHEEYKGSYANCLTQMIWKKLLDEEFTIYGDGSQTRDFIYVDDVVECYMRSIERVKEIGFDVINVGTGKEYSFNEIAKKIGVKVRYTYKFPENYIYRTRAIITKMKEVLGYYPRVNINEGIDICYRYYERKIKEEGFEIKWY